MERIAMEARAVATGTGRLGGDKHSAVATLWFGIVRQAAPVDAQAWQPPPNPGLTGAFAANQPRHSPASPRYP